MVKCSGRAHAVRESAHGECSRFGECFRSKKEHLGKGRARSRLVRPAALDQRQQRGRAASLRCVQGWTSYLQWFVCDLLSTMYCAFVADPRLLPLDQRIS
jgi:hypothetical protein